MSSLIFLAIIEVVFNKSLSTLPGSYSTGHLTSLKHAFFYSKYNLCIIKKNVRHTYTLPTVAFKTNI